MAPMYYRNAAVAVVCFDIMDEDSFQKMKDWVEELRTNIPEGKIVLAIACNKVRNVEVWQVEAPTLSSSSLLLLLFLSLSGIADCGKIHIPTPFLARDIPKLGRLEDATKLPTMILDL